MKRLPIIALASAVLGAVVLAFALKDVIRDTVIIPLAYLWWVIGLYYDAFPQIILWIALIVIVLLMIFGSLNSEVVRKRQTENETKLVIGPVEGLAISVEKSRGGVYVKWQIAHRLGKLARDLLIQRGDRESAKVIGPLVGRDWHPTPSVENYLEVGLNGSFADYPNPPWPFGRPQPTPLDLDVHEAVEFLESQMETNGRR